MQYKLDLYRYNGNNILYCQCPVSAAATGGDGGSVGSVTDEDAPRFTLEPEVDYYVLKNRPATVTCKAVQAVQVSFYCVGRWVQSKHHVNIEQQDPVTGERSIQTSIDVSQADVQDYDGREGYWCQCHAWNSPPSADQNGPKLTKSRKATIHVACEYFVLLLFRPDLNGHSLIKFSVDNVLGYEITFLPFIIPSVVSKYLISTGY